MRDLTPTELRLVKKAVRDAYEKGRRAERREFDAFLSRMRALKELNGSADSFLKAYSPGEKAKGRAVEMEHTSDPGEADRIAADHLDEDPAYYSKLDAAGLADGGKTDDNPHDLVAEAMLAHAEESLSTGADPLPGLDRLRDMLDDPAALAELLGQSGADDATVGKAFRVFKGFDESKVHRDHGKFSSNSGENSGYSGTGDGAKMPREYRSRPTSPRHVTPVNVVGHTPLSRDHVATIAADMRDRGWVGRPLLTIRNDDGDHQALTGSHRLLAAAQSELDEIPVVSVGEEEFLDAARRAGFDLQSMADTVSLDDEERSQIADELGGDAAELMREELDQWGDGPPGVQKSADRHSRPPLGIFKAWDESKHPRGKGGHFISKDRIEAAKTDPKLAKELRKEVKPEDAGKLDAALEGKTDLGRTKRGQAKHEAAGRRATKDEAKAKTQEFIKHFQKVGDLKADLTADHLYDLAEHLKSEHVTIDDVRQLRTALHGAGGGKASFGGQRKRQALVDALRDHARGRGLKERAKELGLDGGELSAAVGTRDAGEPAPVAAGERQAPATTGQYGAWGRAAAGEGEGGKNAGGKKPKKTRARASRDTVLSVVKQFGGIDPNSVAFRGHYSNMANAVEDNIPIGVFRKGGRGLDQLAQELQSARLISVPDNRDAGEYLLELIKKRAHTHAADLSAKYDEALNEHYRLIQEAEQHPDRPAVEEAVRLGEAAGRAEGEEGARTDYGGGVEDGDQETFGDVTGGDASFDFGANETPAAVAPPAGSADAEYRDDLEAIPRGGNAYVGGHLVRRMADGRFQWESKGKHTTGTAEHAHTSIQRAWANQAHEKAAIDAAMGRHAAHAEPDPFTDPQGADEAARRKFLVPDGTRAVSLDDNTRGRTGTVRRDPETGQSSLVLDGGQVARATDWEPLNERHSWRVPERAAESDRGLFDDGGEPDRGLFGGSAAPQSFKDAVRAANGTTAPDLAPAPPAATPPAPATGVAADEAELAALNRTPAKKLTPAQRKRKDQLSREFTARKFPGATPVMMGGGKGPGVSDAENESTAAKHTSPATTVDTPAGADYSSGKPATGTGGTKGGAKVQDVSDESVAASFGDIRTRNSRPGSQWGGAPIVSIPELYDHLKGSHPGLTLDSLHNTLKRMQDDDKLTLEPANDPRFAPRREMGIQTPNGLAYTVQMRGATPPAPGGTSGGAKMNVEAHGEAHPRTVRAVTDRLAAGKEVSGGEAIAYLTGLQSGDDHAFAHQAADHVFRKLGITENATTGDFLIPANKFGEFAAEFARVAGPRSYAPHVVVGDTFTHKDALRRAGGVWDARGKVWYVPPGTKLPDGLTARPRNAAPAPGGTSGGAKVETTTTKPATGGGTLDLSDPAGIGRAAREVAAGLPGWNMAARQPDSPVPHKVTIVDAYEALKPRLGGASLDDFKAAVVAAQNAGHLTLEPVDMRTDSAARNRRIAQSEVLGGAFHAIAVPPGGTQGGKA